MIRDFLQTLFGTPARRIENDLELTRQKWHSRTDVEEQVKQIVAEETEITYESLSPDSDCCEDDDSVGTLEVLMRCEEDFGIEIPDEDAEKLLTVREFTNYIFEKLHSPPAEQNS